MIKSEKLMILLSLMLNVSNGIMAMDRLSDKEELDTSNKVESCPHPSYDRNKDSKKYSGRYERMIEPEKFIIVREPAKFDGWLSDHKPWATEDTSWYAKPRIIIKDYLHYRMEFNSKTNKLTAYYNSPKSEPAREIRPTKKQIQTFIDDIDREKNNLTEKERAILQNALNEASE